MTILSPVGVLIWSTQCFLHDILDRAGADAAQAALFGEETDSDSLSLLPIGDLVGHMALSILLRWYRRIGLNRPTFRLAGLLLTGLST
jgi:hypothetical protein